MISKLGKKLRRNTRREDEPPVDDVRHEVGNHGFEPSALDIARSEAEKKNRVNDRPKEKGLPAFAEFGGKGGKEEEPLSEGWEDVGHDRVRDQTLRPGRQSNNGTRGRKSQGNSPSTMASSRSGGSAKYAYASDLSYADDHSQRSSYELRPPEIIPQRQPSPIPQLSFFQSQPQAIHTAHDVAMATRRGRGRPSYDRDMNTQTLYNRYSPQPPTVHSRVSYQSKTQQYDEYGYPITQSDQYYPPNERTHYNPTPVDYYAGYQQTQEVIPAELVAWEQQYQQLAYPTYAQEVAYSPHTSYESNRPLSSYSHQPIPPQNSGWDGIDYSGQYTHHHLPVQGSYLAQPPPSPYEHSRNPSPVPMHTYPAPTNGVMQGHSRSQSTPMYYQNTPSHSSTHLAQPRQLPPRPVSRNEPTYAQQQHYLPSPSNSVSPSPRQSNYSTNTSPSPTLQGYLESPIHAHTRGVSQELQNRSPVWETQTQQPYYASQTSVRTPSPNPSYHSTASSLPRSRGDGHDSPSPTVPAHHYHPQQHQQASTARTERRSRVSDTKLPAPPQAYEQPLERPYETDQYSAAPYDDNAGAPRQQRRKTRRAVRQADSRGTSMYIEKQQSHAEEQNWSYPDNASESRVDTMVTGSDHQPRGKVQPKELSDEPESYYPQQRSRTPYREEDASLQDNSVELANSSQEDQHHNRPLGPRRRQELGRYTTGLNDSEDDRNSPKRMGTISALNRRRTTAMNGPRGPRSRPSTPSIYAAA